MKAATSPDTRRWLIAAGIVLALILVPFLAFGGAVETWVAARMGDARLVAPLAIGALALDTVLPVPSSLVSIGAGAALGFWGGFACIWAGMTLGSLFGYALGRELLRRSLRAPKGAEGLTLGLWAVMLTRPVPVLAEAATMLAGYRGMEFGRYLAASIVANAVVAAMYAAAGAWAARLDSPLLILLALLMVTVPLWLVSLRLRRGRTSRRDDRRMSG